MQIVIVGAGLAGLSAATWLARTGHHVALLESTDRPGGRACTDLVGGHAFDRGAHALYRGGAAAELLPTVGIHPVGAPPPTHDGHFVWRGHAHPVPFRADRLLTASWMGLAGRAGFGTFTTGLYLGSEPGPIPVSTWLADLPDSARDLARTLVRLSCYTGDLDRLDARVAARQVRMALRGVCYVEGGWSRIVDALSEQARQAGVRIHPATAARRVVPGEVHTDQGVFYADHVVLAVPPTRASRLLDRVVDAPPAAQVASMQLAIRDAAFSPGAPGFVLQDDPPIYLTDFSRVVALGPPGTHVVHAIHYAPRDHARDELHHALDATWTHWRQHLVAERFLPSMATTASLPGPDQPRPDVRIDEGLWGIGDGWGGHGLMSDAALHSARIVTDHIGAANASHYAWPPMDACAPQ